MMCLESSSNTLPTLPYRWLSRFLERRDDNRQYLVDSCYIYIVIIFLKFSNKMTSNPNLPCVKSVNFLNLNLYLG